MLSDRMTGPFCPVMRSDVCTITDSVSGSCRTLKTVMGVVAVAMSYDRMKRSVPQGFFIWVSDVFRSTGKNYARI